jgi:hypothetical protein
MLWVLLLAGVASLSVRADVNKDIWSLVYNSGSLPGSADSDGDGQSNDGELVAGTNPLRPDSLIRITSVVVDGSGVRLTFPTHFGKRYQVQNTAALSPAGWSDVNGAYVGTGNDLVVTVNVPSAVEKYYRVQVQDGDSDGDGVNDWAEQQVGYDPYNSHSKGLTAPDDLASLTAALQSPNIVTVGSSDSTILEPPNANVSADTGTFVITRTGNLNALTVNYTVSGGAAPGSDYVALSGSVALGIGVNTAAVTLIPLADSALESPEAVIITIAPGVAYQAGAPSAAGALIKDNVTANGMGLRAEFFNEATNLNGDGTIPPGVAPAFTNRVLSRIDPTVDYDWVGSTPGVGSPSSGVNVDYFASRWSGEVLPEFSQIYTFEIEENRCARLWVNGQLLINKWPGDGDVNDNAAGTYSATVELVAGTRYPILLEQFETTGDAEMHLRWASNNQPKQIIPKIRLFADTAPQITSSLEVLLIKDSGPTYLCDRRQW